MKIVNLTEKFVAIGIMFPRYPIRTIEMINIAKEKTNSIIAMTNSSKNLIGRQATICFRIPNKLLSFIDTYTALMAFFFALADAIGKKGGKRTEQALKSYDEMVSSAKIFKIC
jgi:DNA-binding MurR/RpiR family transcriptional regulator